MCFNVVKPFHPILSKVLDPTLGRVGLRTGEVCGRTSGIQGQLGGLTAACSVGWMARTCWNSRFLTEMFMETKRKYMKPREPAVLEADPKLTLGSVKHRVAVVLLFRPEDSGKEAKWETLGVNGASKRMKKRHGFTGSGGFLRTRPCILKKRQNQSKESAKQKSTSEKKSKQESNKKQSKCNQKSTSKERSDQESNTHTHTLKALFNVVKPKGP